MMALKHIQENPEVDDEIPPRMVKSKFETSIIRFFKDWKNKLPYCTFNNQTANGIHLAEEQTF